MVLVRVLQRKDAASLVVAIAAGLIVAGFVTTVTAPLASMLSGVETTTSLVDDYWHPFIAMVLQLVALEIVVRLAVALRGALPSFK